MLRLYVLDLDEKGADFVGGSERSGPLNELGDCPAYFQYLGRSPEGIEQSIQELLEREYRRRLAKYEHTDRLYQKKYGMTLDEFDATGVVEARGYSWEVESDAGEWELAVDGIRSMRRRLEELLAESPHAR